jgi:hypothetical protein
VRVAGERCADVEGFSLHADVRVPGRERSRLERLARYVLRPALATERLSETGDGRLAYHFKKPWSDGSTHVVFTPQVFLERLAALIPPPRAHLVTYQGVLAPGAALRDLVVPAPPRRKNRPKDDTSQVDPLPRLKVRNMPDYQRRYPWSDLLLRIFLIDVLQCPCGGRRRLIALILDPAVVVQILKALGLPTRPPPICAARPPPGAEQDRDLEHQDSPPPFELD